MVSLFSTQGFTQDEESRGKAPNVGRVPDSFGVGDARRRLRNSARHDVAPVLTSGVVLGFSADIPIGYVHI